MSMENQIYRSLGADEIRVLVLHPGLPEQEIECHVEYISLSQDPRYEALSYEWGNQHASKSMKFGKILIPIRENLWNVLLQLRKKHISRALWIDALCINQSNYLERNHQVGLMGKIYQQAARVCVWLGATRPDLAGETFNFIRDQFKLDLRFIDSYKRPEFHHWECLLALCTLHYWKRLWIIQEVVLATNIDIYRANEVLPWGQLAHVFTLFGEEGTKKIRRQKLKPTNLPRSEYGAKARKKLSLSVPYMLDQQRRTVKKGIGASVFSLFSRYKDAQCSEKKDKIFGFLGLADTCCRDAVPVNYALSSHEIYMKALDHQRLSHWDTSHSILGNIVEMQGVIRLNRVTVRTGFQRRIECVTPRLSSISPDSLDNLCKETWFPTLCCESPKLNRGPVWNARDILSLFARYALNVVHEVDDIIYSQVQKKPATRNTLNEDTRLAEIKSTLQKLYVKGRLLCNSPYGLPYLVQEIIRSAQRSPFYSDYVLFLDEAGTIGLSSAETRINDMYVEFGKMHLSAVVREGRGNNVVIGWARHLTSCNYSMWERHKNPLDFQINFYQMRVLTRPTPYESLFLCMLDGWYDVNKRRRDFKAIFDVMQAGVDVGDRLIDP
jgi:hypothetical protein